MNDSVYSPFAYMERSHDRQASLSALIGAGVDPWPAVQLAARNARDTSVRRQDRLAVLQG